MAAAISARSSVEAQPVDSAPGKPASRVTPDNQGVGEYQACSDKECFPPQRLPLTWSVNIGPLDDTRIVPATQAAVDLIVRQR